MDPERVLEKPVDLDLIPLPFGLNIWKIIIIINNLNNVYINSKYDSE
jgi:hypothetical protein